MKATAWVRLCLLVWVGLAFCVAARGQTNGEIRGSVTDASGAVVPGVSVTATQTETQSMRSTTSGSDGTYDIPELPVGTYTVTTDAKGFKKFVANGVVVSIGHVQLVNVTLQVGGQSDTVTVEANAAQVETTSTQLGAVMTDTSIRELPLNTRNAYALLQLQPGVQSQLGADLFAGSENPGVVSVNGGRGRSNNYMVNGGDGNDIFINGPAIQPSPDAIEEFRVITNTFDAEYGRNSGSVVNVVTKSGTNAVHGDFYEFLRNDALNTKGYFDNSVAPYKQNQFGATIGAPIKKDRTFIFGSYEGLRLHQGISTGTVFLPTADEAGGNFSENTNPQNLAPAATFGGAVNDQTFADTLNARPGCAAAAGAPIVVGALYSSLFPKNQIPTACFDPVAAAIYKQYVAPLGTGTFSATPPKVVDTNQFTVRFDHNITASGTQKFSAYYYFENDGTTLPISFFQGAGGNVPGFGSLFGTRIQQWNLSHTWMLGSNAVNEFRFNYFREGQQTNNHPVNTLASVHDSCGTIAAANCFQQQGLDPTLGITTDLPGRVGLPYINVSGGFAIGNNFEGELPQTGNTFQWTDNYTRTFSKHTLKFGVDVRRQRFDQFLYFDVSGEYTITSQAIQDQIQSDSNFPSYPNYFLGAPSSFTQGAAQREDLRNTSLYLFAQDSYKLKSNLTLNYGLRWELNTPYYDTGNRLQTFRPGQATTQYPCWLSQENATNLGLAPGDCGENSGANNAVFPLGLVFPGDKGVPRGLTSTYYKGFAPRIGIAWSPGATDGWISKITGGPDKFSVRAGWGIFYNPIEQLVLEQFSAEPPFGGSSFVTNPLFNLPYLGQNGTQSPNPFGGVIQQTPQTPCAVDTPGGPNGCVDWSTFRDAIYFGEFQPHLKPQYSEQYNLTLERQLTKSMLMRVAYVGTQSHHLLASHDQNPGNIQTCIGLMNLANLNANNVLSAPAAAGGTPTSCGTSGSESEYFIPPGTVIPADPTLSAMPAQPFKVPSLNCAGLVLPYSGAPGGNPSCFSGTVGLSGLTLVGTRPFSSPNCNPISGIGCPSDGVPVFSNIFAEDTNANSNYNGLQVSLERSYSHGLLFQASYTFSKAIDQGASFENELNPLNFNATRGLSLLDAKNRFVFSPVWEVPVPKYDGFKGKALNGWGISAIITYQSGFPIRVQDENDSELETSLFFEGANTPTMTAPLQRLNPKTNNALWFNPSVANFCDATTDRTPLGLPPCPTPLGGFGNTPHALCCGPAISNTDLVISKKTPINERWDTEFRAEFYNAWNHTQFANPDGDFTDSTFGQILKTREDPRVIQFGLKILF
ncbi:MAG TPA: carboxypeptidase regulatory-like domain-containing protein [Terriglobales bacterium]|nr:carboxypeptidase regulatory-like domain-containing protein [Terriglobales bacterium]